MEKRAPILSLSHIPFGIVLVCCNILTVIAWACTTRAAENLLFFKATLDRDIYTKNASQYDRVTPPPLSGLEEVYVERVPSLRIDIKELKKVVIEKEEVHKDLQKTIDELSGVTGKKTEGADKPIKNHLIKATLYFSDQGAKILREFAQRHNRQIFDLRLQTHRLSIVRILGPIRGHILSTHLHESDEERVREIFLPVKDRVDWK